MTLLGLVCLGLLTGCFGHGPEEGGDLARIEDSALTAFYERANSFYGHFTGRRVNSYAAYNDPALREAFRDTQAFVDYYAQFVFALSERHFERSQPAQIEVEEFAVEGPDRMKARIRITGNNGLPLRWWKVSVVRDDHWVYTDGQWWIVPSKPRS